MNIVTRWQRTTLYKRNIIELMIITLVIIALGWWAALACFILNLAFNVYCMVHT